MKMTKGIRMCKIRADLPVTKKTQSEKIIIQEYRKQFSTYETNCENHTMFGCKIQAKSFLREKSG